MKNMNKISAFIILLFISVCSVVTVLKSAENFPEITLEKIADGQYSEQLSGYAKDNFAWHDKWISLSAEITSGISESIVNDVYIFKSRLLAADISERKSTDATAEIINSFVNNYDGAAYFVAVPTSSGVYGDMLPSYLIPVTEKQQIDNLYEKLNSDIRKINTYSLLKMLKDNYIYYRSDSKWTSYGAFCVYRTVIQKLGFMPISYDKYSVEHITDDYKGNLYSRTQYMECKPDLLDIYEYSGGAEILSCIGYDNNGMLYHKNLYEREAVNSDDMYNLYLGEKLPYVKINTSINNNRKLLVIGDDFSLCFVPFLTQHYNEIVVILPEYMKKDLRRFVNPDEYEQALFLFGIDSLSSDIFEYMR